MVHRWQWRWYRGGKVKDTELGEEEPVWAIQTERVAFTLRWVRRKRNSVWAGKVEAGRVFGQERWRQEECLGRKGGGRCQRMG